MWFEAANATGGIETMEGGKVGLRLLFEDVNSTVMGDLKTSVSSPTHLSVGYHWCEACTFASPRAANFAGSALSPNGIFGACVRRVNECRKEIVLLLCQDARSAMSE